MLILSISAQAQIAIGWTDANDPHADYYILYRSADPDTGFLVLDFVTPLEGTHEYMYADTTISEGIPFYYRIAAVRDLDHSDLSPWARALWYDKSGGTYAFYACDYWIPTDRSNMLMIYTPIENCELIWRFLYPYNDLIAVRCAPFVGIVPTPELTPRER